jgi:hypothetical protein
MQVLSYAQESVTSRDAVAIFWDENVTPFVQEWEEAGIVSRIIWNHCLELPKPHRVFKHTMTD